MRVTPVDAITAEAIARSVFGHLSTVVLRRLLTASVIASAAAGHNYMGADQPSPYRNGLVVSGLLRMYVESVDGRQITVRYAGPGDFFGAALVVVGEHDFPPSGVQSITAARILYLDPTHLRAAARADVSVTWALLHQVVQYQLDLTRLLAGTVFGSIRQRTAMHLLNLSIARSDGALVAPVTQQALADAVGTTRETVARALGELRAAGSIASVRGGVLLRDPERLGAETQLGSGV